ncbi:MAG: helix-turn-helix domain-containing protein [Magnetococcales bacterium]|nr:helix-turn-helix domain-containing protein [Magnetococcales bacterium]
MSSQINSEPEVLMEKSTDGHSQAQHHVVDQEILTIDEAAIILRCTVDTLRRIHKEDLPVYRGPGRCNLYLRDDLLAFIRSRRIVPEIPQDLLTEVLG